MDCWAVSLPSPASVSSHSRALPAGLIMGLHKENEWWQSNQEIVDAHFCSFDFY
jgi:hypothetical protein